MSNNANWAGGGHCAALPALTGDIHGCLVVRISRIHYCFLTRILPLKDRRSILESPWLRVPTRELPVGFAENSAPKWPNAGSSGKSFSTVPLRLLALISTDA